MIPELSAHGSDQLNLFLLGLFPLLCRSLKIKQNSGTTNFKHRHDLFAAPRAWYNFDAARATIPYFAQINFC
jgi:hypothetical protein